MSRRAFLATSALAAPVAATALTSSAAALPEPLEAPAIISGKRKRNVLFISTDDMCNRLGCYGVPVRSPNLDHLAQSGVRFDRHYCQYPLCGPSRTSLMTGLAPDTTRCFDLTTDFRETIPDTVTLPQLFQRNGYFTARAGKVYHYNNPSEIGTPGFDDPASWQKRSYPAGYDRTHDEGLVTFYTPPDHSYGGAMMSNYRDVMLRQQKQMEAHWQEGPEMAPWRHGGFGPGGIRVAQDGCTPLLPFSSHGDLGVAIAGHPSDGDDSSITDYMVAEAAICMMAEHKDDPWFIGSGFFRPHVPFIVPSRYFDMYNVNEIQVPAFNPAELKMAPRIAYDTMDPNYGMTPQQHREAVRAYYAAISFVDAQVGRLLDALERLDLAKDTTIVFWADHGFMVGEHGQWEKTKLFEASARVPFIMAGAGIPTLGKACGRTSEHLNVYPTLAELCELQGVPGHLQGRSMVPLLQNPDAPWDHPALSQVSRRYDSTAAMGYSIRTERYRYTTWADGAHGEELYDYQADPQETRNLAGDPAASTVRSQLRSSLEKIAVARGMKQA